MAKLSETIKTGAYNTANFAQEAANTAASTAKDFVAEAGDSAQKTVDGAAKATKRSWADFLKMARPVMKAFRQPSAGAIATELLGIAGYARRPSFARAIAIFGAGAVVGGGAVLFLSPASGSTMRRKVRLFVRDLMEDAPENLEEAKHVATAAAEKVGHKVDDARTNVSSALRDVKHEAKHVVSEAKNLAGDAKDAIKDRLPNGNGGVEPFRS